MISLHLLFGYVSIMVMYGAFNFNTIYAVNSFDYSSCFATISKTDIMMNMNRG